MAGHSKWKQIKHKKEITDKKKSAVFSKLAKLITIAARDNPDINTNIRLQATIQRAKNANMPKDNIERAISKARDKESNDLKEILIYAVGNNNTAFIVKAVTDNSNRTIQELKQIFTNNNLKMAADGSLDWMFDKNKDTTYTPKFPIDIDLEEENKMIKILETIEDQDDVEDIYFNFNLKDES